MAAQTRLLKGTVLDNEGQPLIGAGIAETGTKNGVVTDLDGNFEIKIPAGRNVMLKVMSLGMVPKDIVITPRQETITVKLEADTELDAAVNTAVSATGTAPCPYPSVLTTAAIFIRAGRRSRMDCILNATASRSTCA